MVKKRKATGISPADNPSPAFRGAHAAAGVSPADPVNLTACNVYRMARPVLEAALGLRLSDREYYLVKEGGLAAAAFLRPELDWALFTRGKDARFFAAIIALEENESFQQVLTRPEKRALQVLATVARHQLELGKW